MNYQITLSAVEDAALSYAAFSQQEWIDNAIHERCRIAIDEIVSIAVENFLAVGEPIPQSKEAIVARAFELGVVKTAAQRQAEAAAARAQQEAQGA